MSRIYASGVKATALSNIIADVAGYISFNDQGVKVVDTAGLKAYLIEQGLLVASTEFVAPATAETATAAAQSVNPDALVQVLVDSIGEAHWKTRADWPTSTDVLSGAALVTAVNAGIDQCRRAAQAVTNHYADINRKLSDYVTEFYYGQGIDALVTPAVVRRIETRAVICTYVTDEDEESAPSPASTLVELDQNDTATYTAPAPPSGRNIAKIRWYRSRSSNVTTDFAYVDEETYDSGNAATLSYTDSKKAEELGEPCPSITWTEPPATMIGITAGPNGMHAGFVGNHFYVCENHVPYAFPEEYRKSLGWPIVGLAELPDGWFVATRGFPYFILGSDAANLSVVPIKTGQACVNRRSIVSIDGAAVYASADGLCVARPGAGVDLITGPKGFDLFDKESWTALGPSSIFAAEYDGCYYFGTSSTGYMLDINTGKLTTVTANGATALHRDILTDTLYYATGTVIKSAFTAGTNRTGTWKSKKVIMPKPANLGWLQVDSDFTGGAAITVKLYRDGTLTDTKTVTSKTPVRVSSKYAIEHELQVEGAIDATQVTLASTMDELRVL
jgi:hypothetical protein